MSDGIRLGLSVVASMKTPVCEPLKQTSEVIMFVKENPTTQDELKTFEINARPMIGSVKWIGRR